MTTPVSTVSGLNHLEGMEVAIVADGSVLEHGNCRDGQITLPVEATSIVIGLPFVARALQSYCI